MVETINEEWIKKEMIEISNLDNSDIERKLIITPIKDMYGKVETFFFSLNGSPPRAYMICSGLFYSDMGLFFVNRNMNRKKLFEDVQFDKELLKKLKVLKEGVEDEEEN